MAIVFASLVIPQVVWYKGFYHWSKAKGYNGSLALLGLLGFPIGVLVMALLKDRCPSSPPINEQVRNCPACGQSYRLGDYNLTTEHIYCTICKAELPKQ